MVIMETDAPEAGVPDLEHCYRCNSDKPRNAFYKHPYAAGKVRKPCKDCLSQERRVRYAEKGGIDASYEQVLKRDYGITLRDYSRMLREQAGRCAICRRGETMKLASGKTRRLVVDHDHATGMVRGLLCARCNQLVWAIEDNHTTLDAVRGYVERWQSTFANGAPL